MNGDQLLLSMSPGGVRRPWRWAAAHGLALVLLALLQACSAPPESEGQPPTRPDAGQQVPAAPDANGPGQEPDAGNVEPDSAIVPPGDTGALPVDAGDAGDAGESDGVDAALPSEDVGTGPSEDAGHSADSGHAGGGSDAGSPDASTSPGDDAGSPATDAGNPEEDAHTLGQDAGGPGEDSPDASDASGGEDTGASGDAGGYVDGGAPDVDPGPQEPCMDNREFFAREIWGSTLSGPCLSCHQPGGFAYEQRSRFILLPPSYPGFIDANFEAVRDVAQARYNNVSQLLLKPSNQIAHGGGMVLHPTDDRYKALEEFVERLESGGDVVCADDSGAGDFADVEMLSLSQTLRKAALDLVGRMPTAQEYARVQMGGELELVAILDEMMREPAFYDRLKVLWNDVLLTDRFTPRGSSVGALRREDWPRTQAWYAALTDADKDRVTRAVAREPLELIAHIVRNDRPFTEVITADYTVFNPYSAALYERNIAFDNPLDESEWRPGQLDVVRDGVTVPWPHAGVLSSPMFLSRHSTTPTNRNRGRTRIVLRTFLATDILRAAERPIDPLAATSYLNPTRDDSNCAVCHTMIDPVAGAFQKFDDNSQTFYRPTRTWHPEMFAPGFGREIMPTSEYLGALRWLGTRMTMDPRFALSMVYVMHQGLTGREPLVHPNDPFASTYNADLSAWQAQERYFRQMVDLFQGANQNLKSLVIATVLGPYYRADKPAQGLSAARRREIGALGTARMATPESIARKINAVMGWRWVRSTTDTRNVMEVDYQIIFGGIDSNNVTERLKAPNGLVANTAMRMGIELSCRGTSFDFTKPRVDRLLFPKVELLDMPESLSGDEVPASVNRIKENIRYLHYHLLGEDLPPGHPELEATWRIFYDTWVDGRQILATGAESTTLAFQCRAERHPETGVSIPTANQVRMDPYYVVRSWQAVLTYLMTDYRFIFD